MATSASKSSVKNLARGKAPQGRGRAVGAKDPKSVRKAPVASKAADSDSEVGVVEKPKSAKWFRRRAQVVDTAAHVLARQGYDATGLTELCDAVGLGRGALYYYIESKENLLSLLHDRVMDEVLGGGEKVLAIPGLSARDQLTALGRDLIRIIVEYPDHVWVFLHEFRALTGERAIHFSQRRREYENIVVSVLQRGVDDGSFDVADVRLTMLAWLGLHNYIYIWYRNGGEYDADLIADTFSAMVLTGIARSPQSRKSKSAVKTARR